MFCLKQIQVYAITLGSFKLKGVMNSRLNASLMEELEMRFLESLKLGLEFGGNKEEGRFCCIITLVIVRC